jgi:hypothetical protein
MTQIRFNFDSGLELNYQLLSTESAKFFADSVCLLTPADICDTSYRLDKYKASFDKFYHERGVQDFFKYSLNDPKLAVGYLKIGKLVDIGRYDTIPACDALRKQLANSTLTE